jgi:hypothetical protein
MSYGGGSKPRALPSGAAWRDPSDAIPDKQNLQNAVLQWCADKKIQVVGDERKIDTFVKQHWEQCMTDVEKGLKFQKIGLGMTRNFIMLVMKEFLTCDYVSVDVNEPEPCVKCGRPEQELLKDGSNAHLCVWMCEGVKEETKRDKNAPKRIIPCQRAMCGYCSKQKEGWNHESDRFFCDLCNNEACIAETERLLSLQKEEPLVPQDGPKQQTKKLARTDLEAFKFMTTEISQKTVREMCGLKQSVIPTKADYMRCGMVYQDENGIPRIVRFKKAKPLPEPTVRMKLLPSYAQDFPKFYKCWHNQIVKVADVKERITDLLNGVRKLKTPVQQILKQLQEAETALQKLSKEEQSKKRKAEEKYPEFESMKKNLERVRELLRASKNHIGKVEHALVEKELQKWYDFLGCGEISDSDCSDDSGVEDEYELIHMEDNNT